MQTRQTIIYGSDEFIQFIPFHHKKWQNISDNINTLQTGCHRLSYRQLIDEAL